MPLKNELKYLRSVGEKLKGARQAKGITQKKAAEDTGITQSFLSAVESGKKTAGTAQIISLIRYYGVSYEAIFGDADGSYTLEEFPDGMKFSDTAKLLAALIGDKYPTLESGAENCLKICVYMLLRTIYRENPRNSEKIFSLDFDAAMNKAEKIISKTPDDLAMHIKQDKRINPKTLELPVESGSALRAFVEECEKMLSGGENIV